MERNYSVLLMRTLKYALLGMLNQQDMTGYELTKLFEGALSEFWSIKQSQIYPELKRLTEEGHVTYQVEIAGQVMEKKLYSITEQGRADFMTWLAQAKPLPPTPKEEFRLQLFYADQLPTDQRKALLQTQLDQQRARLAHLRQNQADFGAQPAPNTPAMSDYLVLLGAIMREESTCAWLEQCLALSCPSDDSKK